ncbi:MAG TPA: hypothetical protein VMT19_08270 [Thermoanaerobaculaceae bacterium]|nr:hypothetical protein [Thermoanaerobaculaceae bacterium]
MPTLNMWRAALSDAIVAGADPDTMWLIPTKSYFEGKATVRDLAENLEGDETALPTQARDALELAIGATFGDAVRALRSRWDGGTQLVQLKDPWPATLPGYAAVAAELEHCWALGQGIEDAYVRVENGRVTGFGGVEGRAAGAPDGEGPREDR